MADDNFILKTDIVNSTTNFNILPICNGSLLNSSMANCTAEELNPFPGSMLRFTSVCAFLIAILGTLGNVATIVALLMSKKLRTPTTFYVVNLAVAELLFCILILPISGAQYIKLYQKGESLLSDTACVYFAVVRYTLTQAELQTILAIALTRTMAVGCQSAYRIMNTNTATFIYIAFIWIYSFVLKLPTALNILGRYVFNSNTMECDNAADKKSKLGRLITLVIEVFIPLITIFSLYIYIFVMVRKSSMRIAKMKKASLSPTAKQAPSSVSEDIESDDMEKDSKSTGSSFKVFKKQISDGSIRMRRFTRRSSSITGPLIANKRDMRLARSIFTIFLTILICSVPVAVIHSIDSQGRNRVRLLWVHILYWIQYCLNIVIYVLMNKQYRDAYLDLFAKVFPTIGKHRGFSFPWETPSTGSSKPMQVMPISSKKLAYKEGLPPGTDKELRHRLMNIKEDSNDSGHDRLPVIPEVNTSSLVESDNMEGLLQMERKVQINSQCSDDDKMLPENNERFD